MKHVKLFESWDQAESSTDLTTEEASMPNLLNRMTPEEFRAAVEEVIARNGQNTVQIIKGVKKLTDEHPYIKYGAQGKEYIRVINDLISKPILGKINPEEMDNIRREVDPEKYEEELKRKLKAEEEELKKKSEMERLRHRALEILDGYKNGSLDVDAAVDQVLGMRYR